MFETRGRISEVLPPDGFALADGTRFTVDAATRYDPVIGSFDGLSAGQYLEVKAVRMGDGVNLAAELEYEGDSDGGQGYDEIYGVAVAVTDTQLLLEEGTVIVHDTLTEWRGDADRWQDVTAGVRGRCSASFTTKWAASSPGRCGATTGDRPRPKARTTSPDRLWWCSPAAPMQLPWRTGPGPKSRRPSVTSRSCSGGRTSLTTPVWRRLLPIPACEPWSPTTDSAILSRCADGTRSSTAARAWRACGPRPLRVRSASRLPWQGPPGQGAVVAVIDTGVDPSHPALLGRIVPGGRDLVDGDDQPWETRNGIDDDGDGEIDEAAGHGTFVASVITAVAPAAGILPLRVLDDDGGGTAFAVAEALAYAIEARVDVINLSLTYHRRSTAVDLLLERAASAGIVVVAAAGNDGASTVDFPASDSNVVGVTATVADETVLTAFANRSPLVQVAAPGEDVLGALDRGLYATWSGTSIAAPFVAGTAALLKSVDPTLDPSLVRDALLQGSRALVDGTWSGVALDAGGAVGLLASTSPNLRTAPAGRLAPSGAAAGTP